MMEAANLGRRSKVLFIGHEATFTGAPLLLLHLLKWLKANTHIEFEIVLKKGGPLIDQYAALAPTSILKLSRLENLTRRVYGRLGKNPPKSLTQGAKAARYARRRNINLAYANTIAVAEEVEALLELRIPVAWHLHEMPFVIQSFSGGQPVNRAAQHGCHYIAASDCVRQGLSQNYSVPTEQITMIHEFIVPGADDAQTINTNRVSVRQELALPQDAFIAGMCGVAGWRKGADLFINTAKHLATQFPGRKIYFLWVGGSESENIRNQLEFDVRQAGLTRQVLFIGFKSDTARYLAAFDALVLLSREDPFPLAMLEAAAFAIPIVCFSRSGGGPEFLENDAGIVVEYGDTLAVARTLVQLSEQPALCHQLGDAARQKVLSRYTVGLQAPKIARFIEQLIETSGSTCP